MALQYDEYVSSRSKGCEDIVLGNSHLKIVELPGKLAFIDEKRKDIIDLTGNLNALDVSAIKSDLVKYFNNSPLSVSTTDIGGYISEQKRNNHKLYKDITTNHNYPGDLERFEKRFEKSFLNKSGSIQQSPSEKELELAKKMGYVQGVCESVVVIDKEYEIGKKVMNSMKVTKEMAQKYAKSETFKAMEEGVFSQKQEQKLEHKRGIGLSR